MSNEMDLNKSLISRHKIFVGIIIFSISLILSFLLAERLTRRLAPQTTYNFAKNRTFAIFQEDESLPFTLKPNVKDYRFTSNMVEFSNLVSTNSFGFRGKEISQEKPKDVYRILLLGDSVTFGWGVEDDQTFAFIAEEALNQWSQEKGLNTKFEVINGGFTAGRSLDSYYVYIKKEAFKFNPDLVVINHFPANDYGPDMSETEWLELDDKGLPDRVVSKFNTIKNGYQVDIYNRNWKYDIPLLRNSHFGILIMSSVDRFTPSSVHLIKKYLLEFPQDVPRLIDSNEIAYCLSILIEKYCPSELMALFEKGQPLISGMKDLATSNSSEIAVAILPSIQQVEDILRHEDRQTAVLDAEPQKTLDGFFKKNYIENLNLLPYFATSNYKDYFYLRDWHLNKEGHKLAGEKLAAFIAENYFPSLNPNVSD